MKKIILSLMLLALLVSCAASGTASADGAIEGSSSKSKYKLIINTKLYVGGVNEEAATDDIIKITITSGTNNTIVKQTLLKDLAKGIEFPKNTELKIKVTRPGEEDTGGEEGGEGEEGEGEGEVEEANTGLLWLGYSDDDEESRRSKIELVMEEDKNLTLIISKNKEESVGVFRAILNVEATFDNSSGVSEAIQGAGIEINNTFYSNGFYPSIMFGNGQQIVLKAILPRDNPDIEFKGFKVSKLNETTDYTEKEIGPIEVVDGMFIGARFVNVVAKTRTVKVKGINASDGEIYVNGEKVAPLSGTHEISDLKIGTKINLIAKPANMKIFSGWTVNGTILSDLPEYTFTVIDEDIEISPMFIDENGTLKISIYPSTNYAGYNHNFIQFKSTKTDGGQINDKTSTNYPGGTLEPLTWNNSSITELQGVSRVELLAVPSTGFYPADGTKTKWSGDLDGTGFSKIINMDTKSKAVAVSFTNELRDVVVHLNRIRDIVGDGSAWAQELGTAYDAKGYSVKVIADGQTFNFKDVTNIIQKDLKWGTVVRVEVTAGNHYKLGVDRIDGSGTDDNYNPADYTHDNTKTTGNPWDFKMVDTDSGFYGKAPYAEGDAKFTMTYRLEDAGNDAKTVVALRHRTVDMKLQTSGGLLNGAIAEDNKDKNISFVYVTNTGISSQDKKYMAGTYSEIGEHATFSHGSIKILSGISAYLYANPLPGSIFMTHDGDNITSDKAKTNIAVLVDSFGVNERNFVLTTFFKSPIYNAEVFLRGYITEGNLEPDNLKVSSYYATRSSNTSEMYDTPQKSIKVRYGIPLYIKAVPGNHYDFLAIDGKKGNAEHGVLITDDNTKIYVDYLHRQRDIILNVYGGREERASSQSKVIVSGTGLAGYDETYFASNKNINLVTGAVEKPTVYYLKSLSGLQNKVKIETVTSFVHNFQKIMKGGTESAADLIFTPIDASKIKEGMDSYNNTNSYLLSEVPYNKDIIMNVYYRLNTYKAVGTGAESDTLSYNQEEFKRMFLDDADTEKARPTNAQYDSKKIYVYSAGQLMWLVNNNKLTDDNKIYIQNDLYFGRDSKHFNGIGNMNNAQIIGSGNVIFDLNIQGRGFIHNMNSSSMSGLTFSRGSIISATGEGRVGIIGSVSGGSSLNGITNASVTIGLDGSVPDRVGGIVGSLDDNSRSSFTYLGNYANVYGNTQVGGIIGYMGENTGDRYTYMFNRGNITGRINVGGIAGEMGGPSVAMSKVYNSGTIIAREYDASGGIVGLMNWSRNDNDSSSQHIADFYNIGTVNAGGGIAGMIVGWREIKSSAVDGSGRIKALFRGYTIGSVKNSLGVIGIRYGGTFSVEHLQFGDWGDWGSPQPNHKIEVHDVYFGRTGGGRFYNGSLGAGLDAVHRQNQYGRDMGSSLIAGDTFNTEYFLNGTLKKYENQDGKCFTVDEETLKNISTFKSGAFEITSGLPAVLESYTTRPTIKDLSEKEHFPAWITNLN